MEPTERLSMLIDDAASVTELDELDPIAADPERQQTWARYHLIGDALRDSLPTRINPRFANRVAAAIAEEPLLHANVTVTANVTPLARAVRPAQPRWRRLAFAAAAAVAAVAILAVHREQSTEQSTNGISPAVAERSQPAVTQLTIALPSRTNITEQAATVMPDGEYQRRLNSYLVNFNEQRAHVGMPSVTPYARVVGFESGTER
ncbi:MAG: sigma-E factor negative regulatory protein [Gammaproteobacteria bacterium]|nr:sigma-E factor negative regulatory protein [Gammaproteobacteria bacterium]